MAGTPGIVVPYPLAMVVCDGIWRDPYTGKNTLIGTFSVIGGGQFPLVHPIMSVYVSLTDGRGQFPITIQLVDVDEVNSPILEMSQEISLSDPRQVAELAFMAANVEFPHSGEFRLKLMASREFLLERRIIVEDLSSHGIENNE